MVQGKKLLIIVSILTVSLLPRFLLTGVRTVIAELPVKSLPGGVAEWNGEDMKVPFLVRKVLPQGTEFLRKLYRKGSAGDASAAAVLVTVVTSGADKRSIHRPERCLQAQGWQIVSRDKWPIPLSAGAENNLEVTRLVVRQLWLNQQQKWAEARGVVIYWFMGHNRLTGSNLKRLMYSFLDRVFLRLNYRWSYALLFSPVQGSVAETSEELAGFASQLLPLIYESR